MLGRLPRPRQRDCFKPFLGRLVYTSVRTTTATTEAYMKRKLTTLVFGAVVCAIILPASLFAGTNPIDRRKHQEQRRIRQGIRSGELTAQEVRKLEREQTRIRRTEARDRADGNLSPKERVKLDRMLNHASRDIYRQKHDNQV